METKLFPGLTSVLELTHLDQTGFEGCKTGITYLGYQFGPHIAYNN